MMTARYSQPSAVATYVMSLVQTRFGAAAVKLGSNRLGATGRLWFEFVVTMFLRLCRARIIEAVHKERPERQHKKGNSD